MPELGAEAKGKEIGKSGGHTYIWLLCPRCELERWAYKKTNHSTKHRLCQKCAIYSANRRFQL
jgi:phage FluMu protein Com